jgi:hypothetical protein
MSTSKSKPKAKSTENTTTDKPSQFYFACRNNEIDTVKSLLPKLTLEEINQIEPNGSTALHAAAYYGNSKVVQLLLTYGAQRMIKNRYGSTPYDEAKTEEIKKLFQRGDDDRGDSGNRFASEKGASFEWIFVKSDPSSYASFNRKSLLKCRNDEEFNRLCRGIRQYYINEDGPLADAKNIEEVRSFIDRAIRENDPKLVVRAYTAETGFYKRINKDLAQMPTHWSGSKHERNMASIILFHPVLQEFSFAGETYRGMTMSAQDLKEYAVDSVFMNKTFLSTSKEPKRAEKFAEYGQTPTDIGVICKYSIKHSGTALEIETMSEFPLEKEVLILPYAAFKVKSIRKKGSITEIYVEEEDISKWTWTSSSHASHAHTSGKEHAINDQDDDDDDSDDNGGKSVQWKSKKSTHVSHSHTSMKKMTVANQKDDDDTYQKMFKDSQEKGKIDPTDLAKWKKKSFGIDPETDTYAKLWNDAKKGKFSKSDMIKWKKECGVVTNDNDQADSDVESFDGDNNPNVFSASNEQSYATSKKFSSKEPFDMKKFMAEFENDSDD